jgi:hypothetical protein
MRGVRARTHAVHQIGRFLMQETILAVTAIVLIKVTAIVVGYKIVKLGYDALIRGAKGEFDFGGKIENKAELKLIATSPGLFFVLFGSFVVMWALFVEKPVSYSSSTTHEVVKPSTAITPEPMRRDDEKR